MNPDLKVYPTNIRIDGVYDWLRPGVSAEVVILVETLRDVVYVPIQAVSYSGKDQYVWVVSNGIHQRRKVTTGQYSEEFIEITSGLSQGEEVLLLPIDEKPEADDAEDDGESEGEEKPEAEGTAPAEAA
jgi:HlyD family secretion protein